MSLKEKLMNNKMSLFKNLRKKKKKKKKKEKSQKKKDKQLKTYR